LQGGGGAVGHRALATAQNVRGGEARAEQILRGGAADCEESGGF